MYNTKNSGVLSPFSLAGWTDYNIQLHLVPGNSVFDEPQLI